MTTLKALIPAVTAAMATAIRLQHQAPPLYPRAPIETRTVQTCRRSFKCSPIATTTRSKASSIKRTMSLTPWKAAANCHATTLPESRTNRVQLTTRRTNQSRSPITITRGTSCTLQSLLVNDACPKCTPRRAFQTWRPDLGSRRPSHWTSLYWTKTVSHGTSRPGQNASARRAC